MASGNTDPADDPWLYHFTHIDNLATIARLGLLADGGTPPLATECAEPSIKQRRRARQVPIPPGGVVSGYVPFYFAPRSPMLYRIHRDGVPGFHGDQCELVYLTTRLSHVDNHECAWVATDRNAALDTAHFIGDATALSSHIDWPLMGARMWKSTPEDGDRMQRRMAELLVRHRLPWDAVTYLGVCSDPVAARVEESLITFSTEPKVIVRPTWYFMSNIETRS